MQGARIDFQEYETRGMELGKLKGKTGLIQYPSFNKWEKWARRKEHGEDWKTEILP